MRMPVTVVAAVALGGLAFGAGRSVSIDAKDAPLSEVVRLLVSQGGVSLTAHPDVANEKVTFAVKDTSAANALRWLCRACNLVVATPKEGQTVVGRSTIDPSVEKDYRVLKITPSQEAADGLLNFIKKVIFELRPNRARDEQGALAPAFEAVCEKGQLKVSAPPVVHREILALLAAITKVQPRRGMEDVRANYKPTDVGFLTSHPPGVPPKLVGEVTLDLTNATPYEAAWALTSGSKRSFFVDPWDQALSGARVTLQADKMPLAEAVQKIAEQLAAERVWYDEAWLFVRQNRRPLFDSLIVRAYNLSGTGPWMRGGVDFFRGLFRAGGLAPGMPYAMERTGGEIVLVSAPADGHRRLEQLINEPAMPPPPGPPRRR